MVTGDTGKEPEIENFLKGGLPIVEAEPATAALFAPFWRIKATTAYFRRIATRYDKLAGNFVSALCPVAVVANWI